MGEGSFNTPLQGSLGDNYTPYNAFPYGGGHIPPSSPSLDDAHQHSAGTNTNYISFGAGNQGLPSYNMIVGSTPFSLFDTFGNNTFSSTTVLTKGNPGYGKQNPM
jgi:hypothetical protein